MRRIPLNVFGMPFGLCGLAGCWLAAAGYGLAPVVVGAVVLGVAAVVWLVVLAVYLRYVVSDRAAFGRDLRDRTAGPFAALAVIIPMLLGAQGVRLFAPAAATVVVDVGIVLTVLLGAWFTGDWIIGPLELDQIHPGYFLPTVAGGLIAAAAAAAVGQTDLAQAMLGLGMICWLVLGSVILVRLLTRPPLPAPLLPTLAIEVAPGAVASLAWFAIHGDHVDAVAAAIGGYGLLMALAQLRLLPAYLRLPFLPSTWAFTFSWAAVATAALHWLIGWQVAQYAVLVAATLLVGGIAVRTIVALVHGTLLPVVAHA
jgi:tellurite resistance protein